MGEKTREQYIADEFNRTADGYDDSRLVKFFQRHAQVLVIDRMKIEKGMDILDLGCGTGWGTIDIASKLEGTGRVIGLDLSEKMIEQARQKLAGFEHSNVVFEVRSGNDLDYEDCFDYILWR